MGNVRVDGQPVHFSATDWQIERGAPCLGEHTEEVLTTLLGLSRDDVAALAEGGRRMTALSGLRVLELSNERIAFAGKLLGDMGADVVLIEPPAGDPARCYPPFLDDTPGEDRSLFWWHYHTSKRGIVLDLDDARDRKRFQRLIENRRHPARSGAAPTAAFARARLSRISRRSVPS